ncbi:carbohydrate sulfotransferase 11-like isoform X2 [Cotesia typhae]|uniref:carbohydrate sulfotransferase 11-like isoform X2 n=1 Tax=Cotesia typhae TaxID=2053667 RepID=UPI003D69747C
MHPDKFYSYPPTFKEFINYILCQSEIGTKMNEHWIPVNNLCTPCQVNFDLILKVETLNEDQNYLINQAKIQNIVKPTWKHQSRNETSDVLKDKYFSQLEPEQVSLLINMFKFDLELFGYSAKDYEKYFRGSELSRSKLTLIY